MAARFDCIVLGVGGFGSAAAYHAARRGLSVLGLEQFSIGHDRGSSHGETRIIRKAYFEHPDYVPLLLRSYALWRELEAATSQELMTLCGLILAGPPAGETISGARLAASRHAIPLDTIAEADRESRFPGFRISAGSDLVYEPEAGFLECETCVHAHVAAALALGAKIAAEERVIEWKPIGGAFRVRTERSEYECGTLIVTAGPWAAGILRDLGLPLQVVRKTLMWFPVTTMDHYVTFGAPAFYFEMPYGHFYGFPSLDGRTLKAAEHSGGDPVADPASVDRSLRPRDVRPLARFLGECLPGATPEPVRQTVCMYTLSPDRHFIVDRHPRLAGLSFGAGFSGHGFKFTPAIGEALVELACEGRVSQPIEFLSSRREAIAGVSQNDAGAT